MYDFLLFLLGIVAGAVLGWRWGRRDLAASIVDLVTKNTDKRLDPSEPRVLALEQHPEGVFAYTSDGEFLAHSETWEGLFSKMRSQWPDSQWRVSPEASRLSPEQWSAAAAAAKGLE